MKHTKSKSVRGGQIENIGPKRQLITWNQGRRGKNIRRIVHGTRETAEKVLQKIREDFYGGTYGIRVEQDTTVEDLVRLVVEDYANNAYKDQRGARFLKQFWTNSAGKLRADAIDAHQLSQWANEWRAEGLSPARCNRRMAFVLRGYRLAKARGLVHDVPGWTALKEAPPRSGTRTWEEFLAVRGLLPPHARVAVTIEYWLGTRSGETLLLEWSQVRFNHAQQLVEIRLEATDTKTSEPRAAIIDGDLYEVLREWQIYTTQAYPTCQTVCHYRGRAIRRIKTAWQKAAVKAGLGYWANPDGRWVGNKKYRGALIHDFRRTAVSNMEDAGIPRKVAMAISGHKTDSVYRRYHIVRKADLVEAGRRLVAHHRREHGTTPPTPEGSEEQVFSNCSPTSQNRPEQPVSRRTGAPPLKTTKRRA